MSGQKLTRDGVTDLLDENGELIVQVYDMSKMTGTTFPTPEGCTMQFGFGLISEDKTLECHIHKRASRTIDKTAEFLYVIEGEMIVKVLSESELALETITLTDNMALMQFYGGHEISLKSETRYFELKQGPYKGRDFDKYILGK
jgi:hypothetical protein